MDPRRAGDRIDKLLVYLGESWRDSPDPMDTGAVDQPEDEPWVADARKKELSILQSRGCTRWWMRPRPSESALGRPCA